jgi:hypothetical protein
LTKAKSSPRPERTCGLTVGRGADAFGKATAGEVFDGPA